MVFFIHLHKMLKLKKYIIPFFLFALLLPTAIQVIHALNKHEHVVCISKTEQHLHELENDCSDLHLQLTVFYYNLNKPSLLVNELVFAKKANYKSQQLTTNYSSNKSSRAPPIVII